MTNYITAKGVQQFSITIASGSTTGTATINPVGSGAFILAGGVNPSVANNPAEDFAYLTLTNSTTITATRNTGTAGTVFLTGSIIDGDTTNLIKSVQFGTVTIADTTSSGTASISSVTNNNAATHLLGWKTANTSLSGINEYPILALSGTTVTATRQGTTGALVVGFVVIEFQTSALNQAVQNVNATSSANTNVYSVSLSSVVMANTISIYAGSQIASVTTNPSEIKQLGSLASTTGYNISVNTAIANAKTYNCTVVEFASGVLNSSVQRNSTTLAAVTSNTTTITNVTAANSGLSWNGSTSTSTTAVLNRVEAAAALTNGTTVTVTKNTSTGSIVGGWEVFEFPAFVQPPRTIFFRSALDGLSTSGKKQFNPSLEAM